MMSVPAAASHQSGHPPGRSHRRTGQQDDGEGERHDEYRADSLQPGTHKFAS